VGVERLTKDQKLLPGTQANTEKESKGQIPETSDDSSAGADSRSVVLDRVVDGHTANSEDEEKRVKRSAFVDSV